MPQALRQLDRGERPDDPLYIRFVTPLEAAGIAGLSHLAMGDPGRAAAEFGTIIESPDASYRRNLGCYTVLGAQATAANHDITTSSELGITAIPVVADLASARTTRLLDELRTTLAVHRASNPAAQEFLDAYASELAA